MGAQLGQQNIEALKQMVWRFSAQLGGAARQHAEELGGIPSSAAMRDARCAVRGAREAIDAASTRFAALIEREAQTFDARVRGVIGGLADVSARLDETAQALVPIAQIVERLDAAVDALAQGARSVERVGAAGNAATAAMDRAVATFAANIVRLDQTVASVFDRIAVGIEGFERGVARVTGFGTDERGEPGARPARVRQAGHGARAAAISSCP